jgi:hypothetical protein
MYIRRNNTEPIVTEDALLVTCDPILPTDPDQPLGENTIPKVLLSSSTLPPLPQVVINEKTLVFRMDSRTLWTRYSLGMINYSVSSFGGLGSTPSVEKNLAKSAAVIGDFFIPYYGVKSGTKIGSLLTVIANNGTKVVEAIKNKRDIVVYNVIWSKQIEELASYLNEINPGQYPIDLITEQFTGLVNAWTTDFNARYNSDFVTDSITLDLILKIAVSGIPNHVNKGYSSIADILSRGIIAQYPLSFVE